MKKAAQVLNKLAAQFNDFWNSGCYIRAILTIVIPSVCIGLLLCLVITGVTAVFDFLCQHYTQLIFAALVIWAFLAWLDKHKANKVQIERETQNIRERQESFSTFWNILVSILTFPRLSTGAASTLLKKFKLLLMGRYPVNRLSNSRNACCTSTSSMSTGSTSKLKSFGLQNLTRTSWN